MSCDIKKKILTDSKELITKNLKFEAIGENTIFFPYESGKEKTTRDKVKANIDTVNRKYNSGKFGRTASINDGFLYGVGVELHPTNELVKETERKSDLAGNIKSAVEVQKADAKRAGIEFDNTYMYDYILEMEETPEEADGYNFGLVFSNKTKYRDYLYHRINILRESPNQSKDTKKQIAQLSTIANSLSRDLKELGAVSTNVINYFKYFNKDLDNINKILSKNPTLENITAVQKYFEQLSPILNVDDLKERFYEGGEFENIIDKKTLVLFEKFESRYSKIKRKYVTASNQYTKSMLEIEAKEEGKDEATVEEKNVLEKFKNTLTSLSVDDLSYWFLPIEGQGEVPLLTMVRKLYDDAVAKKEMVHIQEELMNLKPKAEKILKKSTSGILGFSFSPANYGIYVRTTASGSTKLVSKYSESWENLKETINKTLFNIDNDHYKRGENISETQHRTNKATFLRDIENKRKLVFNKLAIERSKFIDIRKLTEFTNNPDTMNTIANIESMLDFIPDSLQDNFSVDENEKTKYRKELLGTLGGTSNNQTVAERELNKVVEKQLEQLYEFEAALEEHIAFYLEKNKVDHINKLNAEDRQKINEFYFTNSPLQFIKLQEANDTARRGKSSKIVYGKYIDKDGVERPAKKHSTMKYVSYIPGKSEHYNTDFENSIESNPTLLRVWELLGDSYSFLNKNRKYEATDNTKGALDAITNQYDIYQDNALSINNGAKHFLNQGRKLGIDIFKAVTDAISVNTRSDDGTLQLNGTLKSIDEVVKDKTKIYLLPLASLKNKVNLPLGSLPFPTQQFIKDRLAKRGFTEFPPHLSARKIVEQQIRDQVYKSQDNDLINSVVSQMSAVQVFKAKKEVEVQMNFLSGLARRANYETAAKKKQAINLIEDFIERHLYGINPRKKKGGLNSRIRSKEDKEYVKLIEIHIEELTTMYESPTTPEDAKVELLNDIDKLIKQKDSIGKEVTGGAIAEAFFLKLGITAGMGWNAKSQLMNLAIGNLATRQNDGLKWTAGNSIAALSYSRVWKRAGSIGSPLHRNNLKLTDAFLNTLGVFQNSANEIENLVKDETILKKYSSRKNLKPLALVGETEKAIQRPQILAMLGDMDIVGKDGQVVQAFNVKDTSNPHPAFHLVDGSFRLRPDFDTQENRDTWIFKKNQEYANKFGNSGTVPTIIAEINGDYRDTSTTVVKKSTMGAFLMMFKTWVPAYIKRRYGKDGVIKNLGEKGHGATALTAMMITAVAASTLGGVAALSPIIGAAVAGGYLANLTRKSIQKSITKDAQEIKNGVERLHYLNRSTNFLVGGLKMTSQIPRSVVGVVSGGLAKFAQQTVNNIVGSYIISNETVQKATLMKKSASETEQEFERSQAEMQFLLTELATMAQIVAVKALINLLLSPDDEEKDKYKDASLAEKASHHKASMIYYASENLLGRFGEDISFGINPYSLLNSFTVKAMEDVDNILANSQKIAQGKFTYESGPNEGRNRMGVQLERMVIPTGVRSLLKGAIPLAGFDNTFLKDYNPNDFFNRLHSSDFKVLEDNRKDLRKDYKVERAKYYEENYPQLDEKKRTKYVNSDTNTRYPSIKKLFNEDGTIKNDHYWRLVQEYGTKRVDKMKEKANANQE